MNGDRSLSQTFFKVKAHASRTQAISSGECVQHWAGNREADLAVKHARPLTDPVPNDDTDDVMQSLIALSIGIAAWFALVPRHERARPPAKNRSI